MPLISEIKVDKKKMFANFKDIKNIVNINLLKCVNLLLDKKNVFKNTGNFIAIFLLLLSIITLFVYLCKNKENIKKDLSLFSNIIELKEEIKMK